MGVQRTAIPCNSGLAYLFAAPICYGGQHLLYDAKNLAIEVEVCPVVGL